MNKLLATLLLSAAFMPSAFATGFADGVVGSKYAVVDLGSISYNEGSATALSIGGGVQVHPAVAVEVDYLMGGSASYGPINVGSYKLSALQVMAVGHYTFNDQFTAYAKAGLAINDQSLTNPFNGFQYSMSSTDVAMAIGGLFNVSPGFALRAQYMDTGVSSNVLSIGALFSF
ncbi:MAG TPA: outer membrane beta-barrel protein [Gallionellaceae bacterium]|nr:outer membrane beta-barrel protein [Gallionellaceae bacterium]